MSRRCIRVDKSGQRVIISCEVGRTEWWRRGAAGTSSQPCEPAYLVRVVQTGEKQTQTDPSAPGSLSRQPRKENQYHPERPMS
nr:hypothetical protein Itr_chr07CG16490 [Ipomoea trifida]